MLKAQIDIFGASKGIPTKPAHKRATKEKRMWSDQSLHPMSLGCVGCPQKTICGGLNTSLPPFSCTDYCCRDAENCDVVCRYKALDFIYRKREVNGFKLDNVPRTPPLPTRPLPPVIPVLYSGSDRAQEFSESMVCLPLYAFFDRRTGKHRFKEFDEVVKKFRIGQNSRVILTGTDTDKSLERWWGLGPKRLDVIQNLLDLGIEMVTTPNFSLFVNRPRQDDLHSIKRIALTHEEFQRKGIRAALHVNARTQHDWERWITFISNRAEIKDVAYEFATGAGRSDRIDWHVSHLCELATSVGHGLHLTVRTGRDGTLKKFAAAFEGVSVLDTNTIMKTLMRQRARLTSDNSLHWSACPTLRNQPLDELFMENWFLVHNQLKASILTSATYKRAC